MLKKLKKKEKKCEGAKGIRSWLLLFLKKEREMGLRGFNPSYCFCEKEKGNGAKGIET